MEKSNFVPNRYRGDAYSHNHGAPNFTWNKSTQANAENAMGNYMSGIEEMTNGMRTVKIANQEPVERAP